MNSSDSFGTFLKHHHEFFYALSADGWEAVDEFPGVSAKILSGRFDHAKQVGSVTKLSKWEPGTVMSSPVQHDWCEEVFIIDGSLSIGAPDDEQQHLQAGTFAVRPANVPHGPFFSAEGCTMLEFLYYAPTAPKKS